MVAEEHDCRRLIHLGEVADQLLHGVVAVPHERQVLVNRRILVLLLAGEVDALVEVTVAVPVVAAVVLHRYVEHEQRRVFPLVLVQLENLLVACAVADKIAHTTGVSGKIVLIILRFKAEEAVDVCAVPRGGQIGVNRRRLVAERIQTRGQIGHFALDEHLIRRAVVRQERHRIAGEELQLGVGGAAAEGRNSQLTADGVLLTLHQLVHIRHGVLVGLKRTDRAEIREGFVHDHDQIGRFRALFAGEFALCGRKRVRAVALRLLDKRAGRAAQEVENLAVLAAGLPEGQSGADRLDAGVGDERQHEHARQRKQSAEVPALVHLEAALHQAHAHAEQHSRRRGAEHGKLHRCRVALGNVSCRADGGNVAQHDRRAAEQHNVVVDHAVDHRNCHAEAYADTHVAADQIRRGVNRHIADPALKKRLLERDDAALDHVFHQDQADSRRRQEQQHVMHEQNRRVQPRVIFRKRVVAAPRTQHQRHECACGQPVRDGRLIHQRALAQQGMEQQEKRNEQQYIYTDFVRISSGFVLNLVFNAQKSCSFRRNGKAAVVLPQRLLKSLEFMPQAFLLRG